VFKVPVVTDLELKCGEALSTFAFKFMLRRYSEVSSGERKGGGGVGGIG